MKTLNFKSFILKQKIKSYEYRLQQITNEIGLTDELNLLELDCQITHLAEKVRHTMQHHDYLRN